MSVYRSKFSKASINAIRLTLLNTSFNLFLIVFLSAFLSSEASAQKDQVYVYGQSPKETERKEEHSYKEPFLDNYLSEHSEFNYFEKGSLNSYQSVFLDGVDQRFLDLSYNGFLLRDPSHPSGLFNISTVSGLMGEKTISRNGSGLSIVNGVKEESFLEFKVSQLEEFKTTFFNTKCGTSKCFNSGVLLERGGGFSQKQGGVEKDYFLRGNINFDFIRYLSDAEDHTYLFYSGQQFDEDSVAVFNQNEPESLQAQSRGSVFFIGKVYKMKSLRLKAFYLSSYRSQKNEDLKFSQKGEVFEAEAVYKDLGFKVFEEKYDLYSTKDSDFGSELNYNKTIKDKQISAGLTYSELRKFSGRFELAYKSFGVFYRAEPPSLYQSSFNKEFSSNESPELNPQNLLGLRFYKEWNWADELQISLRSSYSRIYDFIDYGLATNSYINLDEVEAALFKTQLSYKKLKFFIQRQFSQNIATGEELPLRPAWTLGLNTAQRFKILRINTDFKWISPANFFDGERRGSLWDVNLHIGVKNFQLSVVNLLDQRDSVFKNLGRRPLTIELKYQKNF